MNADATGPILFFAVVIASVFIALVVMYQRKVAAERRARYTAFAQANGLSYLPDSDFDDDSPLGITEEKPFGIGGHREADHSLTGVVRGHDVCGFTYLYQVTTSNGKTTTTTTYKWAITTVTLPIALPDLQIDDKGIFDGFMSDPIQFESEAFNDRYSVTADNPRYASAVVHPRMMELLMARQQGITRIRGNLLYNAVDIEPEPEDLAATWNYLIDVVELIPSFVIDDYGPGASRSLE